MYDRLIGPTEKLCFVVGLAHALYLIQYLESTLGRNLLGIFLLR